MPNRILRDWTDSEAVNELTADEERLLVRLIMVADDFGCFYGDPRRIRAMCFPFNETVTSQMVANWLDSLSKRLVKIYEHEGAVYLEIANFNQRLRQMRRKFPANPETKNTRIETKNREEGNALDGQLTVNCQSDDGQLSVRRPSDDRQTTVSCQSIPPPPDSSSEVPDLKQAKAMVMTCGIPDAFVELAHADWTENGGKNSLNVPKPWVAYVKGRWRYEQADWRNGTHRANKFNGGPSTARGGPSKGSVPDHSKDFWAGTGLEDK